MTVKQNPALGYEKYDTFTSDIEDVDGRAAFPVGGTQFVYVGADYNEVTVPLADYETWSKWPTEVKTIKSATDCTAVHVWK